MYRPRFSWLCAALVLVVHADRVAGAATVSEDVPVPGGTAGLSRALGIDPVPERGRFMYEVTRLLYNVPEGRRQAADAFLLALRQAQAREMKRLPKGMELPDAPTELVPVPLSTDTWATAIFHRRMVPRDLVLAIVADRNAALLCLALSSVDDGTLQFLADRPFVLERIYERLTPAFLVASASVRVQNNRVVPPGGDAAAPLWESLIAEKVTRPDRFLLQLLETAEGRYAYFYDVIGQLDPPHRAYALGSWQPNAALRADRFKALAASVTTYREAHLKTLPFGRASYDLSMTLMRLQVQDDGTPRRPAARLFWSRVFAGAADAGDAKAARPGDDDPIDAAWLSEAIGTGDVRVRAERLDQLAFAQRVFGGADDAQRGDVFTAVRALSHSRMLVWTIERMGVTAPETYAAAARKAARLGALDGRRSFEALGQFQGALAIVSRMRAARTIDVRRAQALLEQLFALPLTDDGRFSGAVARWLRDEIAAGKTAGPAATIEEAVLAAMSGGASGEGGVARSVTWEGQPYRLDLGAAERRRLAQVRERQEGVPLDVGVELAAAGRLLASEKGVPDELPALVSRLGTLIEDIPRRIGHEGDFVPPGSAPAPNPREPLRKLLDDLARDVRARDLKRAARAAVPLLEASDTLLTQAMMSIAYAAAVGDPDGAVLLADDVSLRHDFGLGLKDVDMRQKAAWAVPRVEVNPGVPWHVFGSLVGLDIGLSQLALRRLNYERVLEAPRLTSNERDTFAVSVSLLNPFDLRDADRDRIAAGLDRGRGRIASLIGNPPAIDQVADDLSMEGWRRRAIRWMTTHEPDRVGSMFTLTETLQLGGTVDPELHRWGMSMLGTDGCPCSRLMPPGRWPTLLGRPPLGLTGAAIADLHLHTATMLRELRLPAALAKVVLSAATQDFIDEVKPTDDADWLTLARGARTMNRERMEDYIAAATAAGPLLPANGTREERR